MRIAFFAVLVTPEIRCVRVQEFVPRVRLVLHALGQTEEIG